ncbi:CPBP family intramembrane metalloprotease [Corynebacterium breve]|uniref:CPBP family intramembrane metalloprotease n=1 Tax=Corynebacterium breve TaxID=3049799 RepID=A0ABY8VFY8_9CORY|nr:CPBP family intramembrane glutamic endopeptidase [Corynebacterium breve]WIM68413.1 CPBP family intramembrane metalloprotease [Corynebacterium breve]
MATNTSTTHPRIPATWWGLLLRAVVAFFFIIISNFAVAPALTLVNEVMGDSVAGMYLVAGAMALTSLIVIGLVAVWMRWVERSSIARTGLYNGKEGVKGFFGGFALVGIAVIVTWGVAVIAGSGIDVDITKELAPPGQSITVGSLGAVAFVIISRAVFLQGLPEELIYRGWLVDVTRDRLWLTMGWTTAAFTIIHLVSSGGQESVSDFILYLVTPLGMSIIAIALVLRTGSVWWAVGTHGGMHIWSSALMLLYPIEEGPVEWIVSGVVQALIGAVILWDWRCRRQANVAEQI